MRQQSNTLKRKEQAKNSQEQLNEEKTGNLPEKEFRVMIVTMISKILGKKWRQPEYTTKDSHQITGEQKRKGIKNLQVQFSSVAQSCPTLRNSMIAAHQASLSITNSWSSLRLTSIESVMPSSHLILCHPLLLLPPISPSSSLFQ